MSTCFFRSRFFLFIILSFVVLGCSGSDNRSSYSDDLADREISDSNGSTDYNDSDSTQITGTDQSQDTTAESTDSNSQSEIDTDFVKTVNNCDRGSYSELYKNVPPSTIPPGGLVLENVPQFIAFGFDDNTYDDSMTWITEYLKGVKNPAGTGNECTFDNMDVHVSFFVSTHSGISSAALINSWEAAYSAGHEIGDHTDTHDKDILTAYNTGGDSGISGWQSEITTCNNFLTENANVSPGDIVGFRTPFLAYSPATFTAVKNENFLYDCSIEHYMTGNGFDWPYTLDSGKSSSTYATGEPGSIPGLWEMPVGEFMPEGSWSGVTGFDWNVWCQKKMSKDDAVKLWMDSLKLRMEGNASLYIEPNRAPFFIGVHTDIYSEFNDDANTNCSETWTSRRSALEEFITQALAYNKDVRIVSYNEVVSWMQRPIGLDGTLSPPGE
ncbi:MAG: hypothetical protein JXR91_12280 [Deltaproteobacteria bacterium]|nr:hypothetical protein [Deltaproteobacteria bacterium]